MKKTLSIMLVCLLLVGSVFALASCGNGGIPNGTYANEEGIEMVVSGNKISSKMEYLPGEALELVMTYTLNADKTEITTTYSSINYSGSNQEINDMLAGMREYYEEMEPETSEFELGNGYFVVDGERFDKK